MIVIKKTKSNDLTKPKNYFEYKIYKFIPLVKTIEKTLETILAKKLHILLKATTFLLKLK